MKTPKVSVIIPCHNAEEYLSHCLNSVATQTLSDIEIICVDDRSTDRTPQILREYAAKDSRFVILTQKTGTQATLATMVCKLLEGNIYLFLMQTTSLN